MLVGGTNPLVLALACGHGCLLGNAHSLDKGETIQISMCVTEPTHFYWLSKIARVGQSSSVRCKDLV
jgi:hypothetical protein